MKCATLSIVIALTQTVRGETKADPKPLVFTNSGATISPRVKSRAKPESDSPEAANPFEALMKKGGNEFSKKPGKGEMEAFRKSLDLDPGGGGMESCGSLPPQVEKDRVAMIAYRKACAIAKSSSNQRMAINDYSCTSGAPKMYLFDADGQCKYKTGVSFGSGKGRDVGDGCPKACSEGNERFTPPGYHMTVTHNGATYKDSTSLGLAGLEGQGSKQRAILIHKSLAPGTACSWGCSGVADYDKVRAFLGKGALVYNSFQPNQVAANCRNTAGMTHSAGSCRMDPGGSVERGGGGDPSGSGGATSMLERLREGWRLVTGNDGRVLR